MPQHIPSTGQTNETKAKTSELGASDHNSPAPEKHPSSHAEKHSDYDRMSSENKKALDKKAIKEAQCRLDKQAGRLQSWALLLSSH